MGSEHKKALIIVFALLLIAVLISTVFLAVQIHYLSVTLIMSVLCLLLISDIVWVIRSNDEAQTH